MKDERGKGEEQSERLSKNSRQDRLKLALRENLKRRKSQARGRGDAAGASSGHADSSLDKDGGKKPGG
jgi:hypothetical protein